ncbi:MAG: type II toxin-antitoxin system RelE/ParE family toxin [Steroidobacteraceae bacterium]|nr:type II toxin-antitoxin system RelE/ParE family toxin [Steroidobacteraceae bacterium]MBP7014767.1 type II toxin-antitoxin system RelE/ParE family toxin [Steroidobacteraceae bacterium]
MKSLKRSRLAVALSWRGAGVSLAGTDGTDRPFPRAGIRSFPVRDYVLVYRPILGGVELVRVVHGARDLPRVLS